jgi:hypothetical protein
MRMRRLWLVLGILLVPTLVHADDHRARAFFAMSQAYQSILGGFYGSFDATTPVMDRDVGVLGELSVYAGSHDDIDETNVTFLLGPTVALFPKPNQASVFSGHLLLGVVNSDREGNSDDHTGFGLVVGGAWDYSPGRARDASGFGARVQVDWVWGEGRAANFLRTSVGGTYTWH